MKHPLLFLCVWGLLSFSAAAQTETIRMMHYNLLYYTNQAIGCNQNNNNLNTKDAALQTIIEYVMPDVLVVNELGSSVTYADRIVNNVLNTNGRTYFNHGPLTNYSGGDIANMLFYNSEKLSLHSHFYITTVNRDINGYKMYYNTPNLAVGDTIFTTFLLAHLKAGTGSDNEQKRYSQVVQLMAKLENIGVYGNYCFSGDFNLYSADEEAYQYLINYPNSLYKFYDPINQEGKWNNNSAYRSIHTQSTHSDNNGCASSGGLDDRFDFILVSPPVYYGSRKVKCISESYHALGNDGNHFNKSINEGENQDVPAYVANALYTMSDHLPLIMDLEVDVSPTSVSEYAVDFDVQVVNPIQNTLKINLQSPINQTFQVELYSMEGKLLKHIFHPSQVGANHIEMDFPYASGLYFLKIEDSGQRQIIKKLIKY